MLIAQFDVQGQLLRIVISSQLHKCGVSGEPRRSLAVAVAANNKVVYFAAPVIIHIHLIATAPPLLLAGASLFALWPRFKIDTQSLQGKNDIFLYARRALGALSGGVAGSSAEAMEAQGWPHKMFSEFGAPPGALKNTIFKS